MLTEHGETPTVVSIHIAPATRLPTRPVPSVLAEAGKGLVGDRYHGTKHRHVTVQSATSLETAAAVLGRPVDPGLTRRNLTLSGGDVPTTPGVQAARRGCAARGGAGGRALPPSRRHARRRCPGGAPPSGRHGLPRPRVGHHQRR